MEAQSLFLEIISAYIHGKKLIPPANTNWKEILYLSELHSVSAIMYIAVGNYIKDAEIHKRLKQDFLLSVKNSTLQETEMEKVIKILTENNIEHMLMKGYVLRNYYPDKEARTFGDIDFLIKETDRIKSHQLLVDNGYKYDKNHFIKQVYTYTKNSVVLEVHTEMIYQDLFLDVDYIDYFNNSVKKMLPVGKCTYELPKEDHFVYVMVHLAEHFYKSGVGVRMLLDIAVFLNKYKNEMNMEYINNEFVSIKLSKFVNIIYNLCKNYFDVDIECTPINTEEENLIINYILQHGTFGYVNKNIYDIDFHRNNESFLSTLKKRFFPKYKIMVQRNEWFKNGKKYMLPYAWVRRWMEFALYKNKRDNIQQKFIAISKQGSDSEKHNVILNMVGLK